VAFAFLATVRRRHVAGERKAN